jgi:hypothetical protein
MNREIAFTGFGDDDPIIAKLVGNAGISLGTALNFKRGAFANGFSVDFDGAVDLTGET